MQKYDTVVGPHGHPLSKSQTQRLGIARALVRNPRFFLFDDEPEASQDAETDMALQVALDKVRNFPTRCWQRHQQQCFPLLLLLTIQVLYRLEFTHKNPAFPVVKLRCSSLGVFTSIISLRSRGWRRGSVRIARIQPTLAVIILHALTRPIQAIMGSWHSTFLNDKNNSMFSPGAAAIAGTPNRFI